MSESFYKYKILPLKFLCHQNLRLHKSQCNDLSFIKKYYSTEACLDFNGLREAGVSLKPKSRVIYEPLIDKTPSDPSTILTVMHEAERITQKTGQTITVFTQDQQLYKIVLDMIWSDILRWMEQCDTKARRNGVLACSCALRAHVLACFTCSLAWRALRALVLTCLACCAWRAWHASKTGVLGVRHKMTCFACCKKLACLACFIKWCVLGVLHKMACLACFIKWRA